MTHNMVFTLGLRHTLAFCSSRVHLVQSLVIRHLLVPLGTGVVKTFRCATRLMTDGDRSQQLRSDLPNAFKRARNSLRDDESVAGILELYDHGLFSSLEIMALVWEYFYTDDAVLNRVCEQLRDHQDDSIRRIPDYYNDPESRKHRTN